MENEQRETMGDVEAGRETMGDEQKGERGLELAQ